MLRLYPAGFRTRFSYEMVQVYQDLAQEAGVQHSSLALLRLWAGLIADLFPSIIHEWRDDMNRNNLRSAPAVLLLTAWLAFTGVSFGRSLFHWPIKPLEVLLLGEEMSSLELFLLDFSILFIPLIAFLISVLPSIQIERSALSSEILQVHVQRLGRGTAWLAAISGGLALLVFSVIFAARILGW
jgi:hypothetical protein